VKRLFWLAAVAACGGGTKKQPEPISPMENPAWAIDYERQADEGCKCAEAECLEKAHTALSAIEVEHGGMDEVPPSVHVAHGKFDKCWREGTRDIGRDFEQAAQNVCTCTTSECLRLGKIEIAGLTDGKYRENLDAQLAASPNAVAASKRAVDCITKATMPAGEALAMFDRITTSMCACKDFNCVSAVYGQRSTAMGSYLEIDETIDATKVAEFKTKFCGCLEKAATDSIKNLSPVPSATSVDLSMKCD
jgi:hypothetical protein